MNKSKQNLDDWLVNDEELIFQVPSFESQSDGSELADNGQFSDLMSDGDIFGAEIRQLNRPTDGYWSEIIDNPSLFTDFDLLILIMKSL